MKKFLFFIIPFLLGVFSVMFIGFFVFYYYTEDLPDPETLLPASARILYSNGSPLYLSRSLWMNLDEVPEVFIKMLLASEDRKFYEHAGLRIKGIIRAIWVNLITQNPTAQGGSTITQQLVRTLYLSPQKTIERKIKEMLIALWLERHRSKDEILEMYINSVYLGNGLYGFGIASIYYFGKPLKDLDIAQMAVLIGVVKSPENYNPFADEKMAKMKGEIVLKAALDTGVLDKADVEKAKIEIDNMVFKKEKYYFDEEVFWRVIEEARTVTGLSLQELRSGYEIITTLDKNLQNIVEMELGDNMACVAVDKSGKILAFKGKEASAGRKQLGSAIKPMYYLYAFLNG
ncbi:MAG: penicillin-binding protein, partial [Thermotogaceae bacterium]|nr:penicillin-binding protein [Thermotogaceae bacterium]